MKKLFSILLAIVLIVLAMPIGAFPFIVRAEDATEYTEGYYTYVVINDEASIIAADKSISGDVIIPKTLGGYPVTNIGSRAFYDRDSISGIVIHDGITSIGSSAFSWCNSLKSVTIGNGVITIGNNAFKYCENITSLIIGNSVTTIGNYAFYGCFGLSSVTIPECAKSIGEYAFFSCAFKEVIIPYFVTNIGSEAFGGCNDLTIYGYEGSCAQIYADENDVSFIAIETNAGDASGDGIINGKDAVMLLQYVNGWDVDILDAAADVNADGKINNKDYVLLVRYLNDWDITLTPPKDDDNGI